MSTLSVSNITDGTDTVGTSYVLNGSAKAWIYFDGGNNVIKDSLNFSSFTDNSTGNYNVNLTNSMASTSYCWSACNNNYHQATSTDRTVSSYNLQSYNSSHSYADAFVYNTQANGDLA